MTSTPGAAMAAAATACAVVLWALTGSGTAGDVVLGTVGPLTAALAAWLVVARTHARAPSDVPALMIKLFGAKLVGFAAYIAAVVLFLVEDTTAFVVSFTCQYVVLHLVQAIYLRRLFASV